MMKNTFLKFPPFSIPLLASLLLIFTSVVSCNQKPKRNDKPDLPVVEEAPIKKEPAIAVKQYQGPSETRGKQKWTVQIYEINEPACDIKMTLRERGNEGHIDLTEKCPKPISDKVTFYKLILVQMISSKPKTFALSSLVTSNWHKQIDLNSRIKTASLESKKVPQALKSKKAKELTKAFVQIFNDNNVAFEVSELFKEFRYVFKLSNATQIAQKKDPETKKQYLANAKQYVFTIRKESLF